MTQPEALAALRSTSPQTRREAARILAECADVDALPKIQDAYRNEAIWYVRSNLRRAILRLTRSLATNRVPDARPPDYSQAVVTVTRQLVHEVRQYLERLTLHTRALRATGAPVDAITAELSRLDDFLAALLVLSDVSAPPALEEFELSAEIQGLTEEEAGRADYPVSLAGPNPCVVVGDRRILGLIYRNGLRNAIEASLGVNEHPPIVVNWGDSDVDYWLSIADAGTGLPVDLAQMFVVGKTTKRDHLGMGLSIAQHAAEAVNGSINLTPRTVGALFELRWPRRAT